MKTMRILAAIFGVLVFVLSGCSDDQTVNPSSNLATKSDLLNLAKGGRPLSTNLTGAEEAPGPGDPDGSGTAELTLNQGQGIINFEITVSNITLPAIGAHIHVAPAGFPGPVVVPLTPPDASGMSSGTVSVDPDLIKAIRQNPEAYYVNVHTTDFPAGAVRGQLSKGHLKTQ